ncbi:MAG: FAD binding domain-containing protein [Woeseiaceae bacterium]
MPSATTSTLRPNLLPDIDLHCPTTFDDIFRHLGDGAFVLAGGTDMVLWASQNGKPNHLVWTGGVDELHGVDIEADQIRIGAAVSLSRIIRCGDFRQAATAVADGAQLIGSVQLRNQATLVGNLCTASPAGDTIPGLVVHDTIVEIASASGQQRAINITDFLVGPGKTDLNTDEIVTAVRLTPLRKDETSCFQRFTQREALDLAFASIATRIAFEADGATIRDARLALGAVDKTVIEAPEAAAILQGRTLSDAALRECGDAAADTCSPISDHRASADFRRQLIRALIVDVVSEAGRRINISPRELGA